jgi:hypothetical protein
MIEELLKEPEFRFFAAFLHEAYHSSKLQRDCFDLHYYGVREREKAVVEALNQNDEEQLCHTVLRLLTPLAHSTFAYPYGQEYSDVRLVDQRIRWLTQLIKDFARMRVVIPALLAVAASTPVYVPIKQTAWSGTGITGMSESSLRTKCQQREIAGAVNVGNTWLIPEHYLILKGLRS